MGYELVCRSAWAAATGIHACQDGNPIIPHTVQLRRAQAQDDSSWSYLLQEDHKIRAARCMKPVLTFAHFRPLQRPKLKDQTQPEVRRSTLLMASQTVALAMGHTHPDLLIRSKLDLCSNRPHIRATSQWLPVLGACKAETSPLSTLKLATLCLPQLCSTQKPARHVQSQKLRMLKAILRHLPPCRRKELRRTPHLCGAPGLDKTLRDPPPVAPAQPLQSPQKGNMLLLSPGLTCKTLTDFTFVSPSQRGTSGTGLPGWGQAHVDERWHTTLVS